jgi:hypothetical protein
MSDNQTSYTMDSTSDNQPPETVMTNEEDTFFKRFFNKLFNKTEKNKVPEYAGIYFDHLQSEYGVLESEIKDETLKGRMKEIRKKREKGELTWNDVYEFDLALLSVMQPKDLVRKAYDMRTRYRSFAGAKDYDSYVASKPPDLTTLDSRADAESPDTPVVTVETLRADIKYLLKQFYLYYALLPYREGFRDELTRRARNVTLIIIFILIVLMYLGFGLQGTSVSMIMVVLFSGVIGGCMSMLQRIQSAPSEGDPLYNLSALENGWKGISLSPLYGAIFATLLFVLFSAGILKGTIFPEIKTQESFDFNKKQIEEKASGERAPGQKKQVEAKTIEGQTFGAKNVFGGNAAQQEPNLNLNSNSNTNSSNNNNNATIASSRSGSQERASNKNAAANQNSAGEQDKKKEQSGISYNDFLGGTYPANGVSYALLVVWSFIAGFAERLVPDTLNRLVTKNESIQGTNH